MRFRSSVLVAAAAGVVAVTGCASTATTPGVSTTATAAAQQPAAPAGSGHGLCFDVNSDLARSALARLSPPPVGQWQAGESSDNPLSAGCNGVLSWMTANSTVNHPYTHILFFTNGTYLGTASTEPYMYTQITGKTRDSVTVTYHWIAAGEAMCCPAGGPSVVTLSLHGTKVVADGQFPPHN
ncbi:LppP/LprE family lipoprotein [Nocardia yunnanensis]|uniref:LppP/LprE family lipoprotein n=1 Tax=Nocardia yunnanensis TaxID=2382165 RepID=A0A386ZLJ6_9NOCA|nr:LppP/LprE family lipoprotein [Nocardia yunnanensis]AYF77455.1 LppP/LprE family lipoprotein [Nocardia yunnanensis]